MSIIKDVLTKTNRIKFIFLVILLLFSSSCKDPVEELIEEGLRKIKPKTERPLIIAYGDSLTRGNNYKREQAYPSLLQKRLDNINCEYEVLNFGVNGEVTEKALWKLHYALEFENIEIFIIELGANDIAKKVPVSKIRNNLQRFIDRVKSKNIKILLSGYKAPTSLGAEYGNEIDKMYAELAEKNGLKLMPDFMKSVQNNGNLMLADGVHPNLKGIEVIEENVFKELKSLLNCKKIDNKK